MRLFSKKPPKTVSDCYQMNGALKSSRQRWKHEWKVNEPSGWSNSEKFEYDNSVGSKKWLVHYLQAVSWAIETSSPLARTSDSVLSSFHKSLSIGEPKIMLELYFYPLLTVHKFHFHFAFMRCRFTFLQRNKNEL